MKRNVEFNSKGSKVRGVGVTVGPHGAGDRHVADRAVADALRERRLGRAGYVDS